MSRSTTFILATVLWVLAPTPGFAQEAETATGRKNLIIAVVAETAFPVLGHSYAGDARRGLIPAVPLAAGGVVVAHAMAADTITNLHMVGVVSVLVGKVWGIVSVVSTVRDRNEALRERRGVETGFAIRPNVHRQLEFAVNVRLR